MHANRICQSLKILITIIIVLLPGLASAKPKPEDYGSLPTISKVAISPSGKLIAYRAVSKDGDMLLVYSLKDKKNITGLSISEITPGKFILLAITRLS